MGPLCLPETESGHHFSKQKYPSDTEGLCSKIDLSQAATDSDSVLLLISIFLQDFNKLFTDGLLCHRALSVLQASAAEKVKCEKLILRLK